MDNMVKESLRIYFLAALLFLVYSFNPIFCSSQQHHHHHHHHHHHELKSLHFALYEQEIINKTIYLIVPGVAGQGLISSTTSPFGSLFAFNDPITVSPDLSSKNVGTAEGSSITSSFDGLRNTNVMKFNLELKDHVGSISTVGVSHNTESADAPVVGGTGDFLFVQGYVRTSPVKGLPFTYKLEFHLYWPPYAFDQTSLEVEDLFE